MNEHTDYVFAAALHWFWAALFLGNGVFLIWKRETIGSVRTICGVIRIAPCGVAGDWNSRVRDAVARRDEAEGRPAPLGTWMGGISIALSGVAAFSLIPDGLLYAILCLAMAAVSAFAFLHLRNSQRTRVAVLSVRTADKIISPYWFALAVLAALSVLTFVNRPQWAIPSVLVCASSLVTIFIAWRLTQLSSILTGNDLPAEQLVDDRLRLYRSCTALMFAYVQSFVFVTQIAGDSEMTQLAARFITWSAWLAFLVWVLRWQRRAVPVA